MDETDAAVFVRDAPDQLLMLEGIEAVDRRFIGDDLAAVLDFPDEGSASVLSDIALDELKHSALLFGKSTLGQTGLQQGEMLIHKGV